MERARWQSRTIFLLAAIGSAVGLGNVWRFPYLTYEYGGGAFLIPYLIALFLIGIPLLVMEFALGQKLQQGAVGAFEKISPKLRGIGVGAIYSGFVVVTYYAAVMAWSLIYLVSSFQAKLPWSGGAEDYFFTNVLAISDGIGAIGGINWTILLALLVVWVGIYFCVWKGTKSVGKVVLITMPLPIILLIILFIRGITLPGALEGIGYYLRPDFAALLDTRVWLAAISQIFFTLSLGFGIMIAYASFNKKNQNVLGDGLVTAVANSAISLFAGFVVFSVLGYMATTMNVGVEEVVASGPGLAFIVFPEAISLMPLAPLFAIFFFVTLLSLGIDSAFSLVEAVNTVIGDKMRKRNTPKIAFWVCSVGFLLGVIFTTNAGLYFLDLVDHFITNFGLVIVGILEALAVGWIYGADKIRKFINKVSKHKLHPSWDHMIKWVIPAILTLLVVVQFVNEVQSNYSGYPDWAIALGWTILVVPILAGIGLALKVGKAKA